MKKMLVLGAGTAGTMVVNKMRRILDPEEWKITVVDPSDTHYYQPGFLFIPFGTYTEDEVRRPKTDFIPKSVTHVQQAIDLIRDTESNNIALQNHVCHIQIMEDDLAPTIQRHPADIRPYPARRQPRAARTGCG